MSKDGYETEISRLQSKRNLFKFIKTYFIKETDFISDPEEFWWKTNLTHKKHQIRESIKNFIENNQFVQDQNESFAYEGIFDQKENK